MYFFIYFLVFWMPEFPGFRGTDFPWIWMRFGVPLDPLWFHFESLWLPFSSPSLLFVAFFGTLKLPFGSWIGLLAPDAGRGPPDTGPRAQFSSFQGPKPRRYKLQDDIFQLHDCCHLLPCELFWRIVDKLGVKHLAATFSQEPSVNQPSPGGRWSWGVALMLDVSTAFWMDAKAFGTDVNCCYMQLWVYHRLFVLWPPLLNLEALVFGSLAGDRRPPLPILHCSLYLYLVFKFNAFFLP